MNLHQDLGCRKLAQVSGTSFRAIRGLSGGQEGRGRCMDWTLRVLTSLERAWKTSCHICSTKHFCGYATSWKKDISVRCACLTTNCDYSSTTTTTNTRHINRPLFVRRWASVEGTTFWDRPENNAQRLLDCRKSTSVTETKIHTMAYIQ